MSLAFVEVDVELTLWVIWLEETDGLGFMPELGVVVGLSWNDLEEACQAFNVRNSSQMDGAFYVFILQSVDEMHVAVRLVHNDVDEVDGSDGSNLNQVVVDALVVGTLHERLIVLEISAHVLLIFVSEGSKMLIESSW
jgi:hypothetical protein